MFEFTDDLLTGISAIDHEHKWLFTLLEKIRVMLEDEYLKDRYDQIKEVFEELADYADKHMAHEEAYMEKIRDPELISQRAQHMNFRNKIQEFMFRDISEEEDQHKALEELSLYMVRWLYHHIIGSDLMIGKLQPLEEWMVLENPCEFTDAYLTGIQLVDDEHRELFRIINDINKIVRDYSVADQYDALQVIFARLIDYTEEHFRDEEEYMESIRYEGLAVERRAHEGFVNKLKSIQSNPDKIDEDPQKYMERLVEFLLRWLVLHILYLDKKIPKLEDVEQHIL